MPKRRLSVEAVIFNPSREVLLVRPGRSNYWELPGGKVKKPESLTQALVREVHEETGLEVLPLSLIGIFFIRPKLFHDFVFTAELKTTSPPRPYPPEIIDCRFFPLDDCPAEIKPFTLARIADARRGTSLPLPVDLSSDQWLD